MASRTATSSFGALTWPLHGPLQPLSPPIQHCDCGWLRRRRPWTVHMAISTY